MTSKRLRVKWACNLPECKINRGGIKARSYKHAVQRIEMPRPDGGVDKYHFVLEYATPLMNLYDMSTHADAPLGREERDHQVTISKCRTCLPHTPSGNLMIKSPGINSPYPRTYMVKMSNGKAKRHP